MFPQSPTDLRAYFAANAPADIPRWFHCEVGPCPETITGHGAIQAKSSWIEAQRYFSWRSHYADQMLSVATQITGLPEVPNK